MRQLLLFLTVFFSVTVSHGQIANWLWAKSGNGSGQNEGLSVCSDANGNAFVTGYFVAPYIIFGSDTLTTIASSGSGNVFIAKYDANGNLLWARSATGAGGVYPDCAWSVSADTSGNAFITGGFWSPTITFGSSTLTNTDPSGQTEDVFIAKYDVNGNVLWAKSGTGGTPYFYNQGFSVSIDASGNAYITGEVVSPSITFGSTTIPGNGLFLVKYDTNGNVIWAESGGGKGYGVSAETNGNLFLTGWDGGVLIAKYDTNGNMIWGQIAAGGKALSASADASGNVFITGGFYDSTITFGSITLTNTDTANIGYSDVFVAKYDANGNALWAKSASGTQFDVGYSISADALGNAFVSGGIDISGNPSIIIFGSDTLTPPVGSIDPMFIVKYDANGNLLCATVLASGGDDQNGISAGPFDNAYVGGDFMVSPFIFGSDTLTNAGSESIFIAKYNCGLQSVNEVEVNGSISIFPNPFSTQTTLQTDNFLDDGTLTVYNSFGQTVKQINNLSGQTIIFHRENLPSGIYFIRLMQDHKIIATDKLLITD